MLLLAIAIAPCIAIMLFIYLKDKYDKEPIKLLFYSFIGGVLSTFIAILVGSIFESNGMHLERGVLQTASYAFITVALCEEGAKYFFLRAIPYRNAAFNEPFDGIVYAVMVSMGFAMFENLLYVYEYGAKTGLMRAFTAVPAHATFAVIMGYFVGLAKFAKSKRTLLHVMGVGGAVLFHGAYDFSLMQEEIPQFKMIGAIVSLIVAINLSLRAIKISHKMKHA